MNKKILFIIPLLIVAYLMVVYFFTNIKLPEQKSAIESYLIDSGKIEVYFCPQEDCAGALAGLLDSARESIHCALFEIDLVEVQKKLIEKSKKMEVLVVTDNDYLKEFDHPFVKADSWGLMHNKFCIVDGKKISSGSMNPTNNCADKNNNNLVIVESRILAENYEAEFQEMWAGTFKKGGKVSNPAVAVSGIKIKNYFCPEDDCAYHLKEELKQAERSIYFMTFSFTHVGIANILLLKQLDGIEVKGVMEARQVTKNSEFSRLEYHGIDVIKDSNPGNMHHKVFIIDGKKVITGSFNPTEGGDTRNDENLLIIEDETIAKEYLSFFDQTFPSAS